MVIAVVLAAFLVAGCIEEKRNYDRTSINITLEVGKLVSVSDIFNITGEEHYLLLTDTGTHENNHPFCMGICSPFQDAYVEHSWTIPREGVHMENPNVSGIDRWRFSGYWMNETQTEMFATKEAMVFFVVRNVDAENGTVSGKLVCRKYS